MELPRTVILAEGLFHDFGHSKTAYGILRFAPESVVAVIDSRQAGRDCAEVSGMGPGIPVVGSLDEAMQHDPERLVIGVATAGGWLPEELRSQVLLALEKGLEVVNGLHLMLADDLACREAASRGNGRITDLRREPENLSVAMLKAQEISSHVVLTVGTDCNTGKMTAALQVIREAARRGIDARFAATGQTGMAITGRGICVDHVLSDFTAGAAERLVMQEAGEGVDMILVEGQGGLAQPIYSGVTLSLMHGSLPDSMILCHRAGMDRMEIVDTPMPPLEEHIELYENAMRPVKAARVRAVSIHTLGLDDEAARRAVEDASRQTGLPCTDPVRFGAEPLLDAIIDGGLVKVPLYGQQAR